MVAKGCVMKRGRGEEGEQETRDDRGENNGVGVGKR